MKTEFLMCMLTRSWCLGLQQPAEACGQRLSVEFSDGELEKTVQTSSIVMVKEDRHLF